MTDKGSRLCPSSPCAEGATLLGVVQADRTVTMLSTPLVVDEAFVRTAEKAGAPEKRFRFADKCIKSGCSQWSGTSCGVMDVLTRINSSIEAEEVLKPCVIRPQCRWYSQEGGKACTLCTYVVTHNFDPVPGMESMHP